MTFALVLTSIIMFLAVALSLRTSSNEVTSDGSLGGPFRNLSSFWYDGLGSKDNVKKAIDSSVGDIRQAHTGRLATGG
jgi:hypothetical protein